MDLQIILTLKVSYYEWHKIFVDHTAVRAKVCDESRTLVAKANDTTALVTCFDVDMPAFGAMMQSPEFIKLNEPTTEKVVPYFLTPLDALAASTALSD